VVVSWHGQVILDVGCRCSGCVRRWDGLVQLGEQVILLLCWVARECCGWVRCCC
jgi:hypothetical protein